MAVSIGKYAPTAIVLAAVGYCCWPYLDDPNRVKNQEAGKLPEISASTLSPDIAPSQGRDPFGFNGERHNFIDVPQDKNKKKVTGPAAGAKAAANGKVGADGKPIGAKVPEEIDLKTAIKGVTLNATCLRGTRHTAIINNELYVEGALLDQKVASFKSVKVSQILQRRVVLERNGKTADLYYPDITSRPAAAAASPKAATTSSSFLSSLTSSFSGSGTKPAAAAPQRSMRSTKGSTKKDGKINMLSPQAWVEDKDSPLSWMKDNMDSYKKSMYQNAD